MRLRVTNLFNVCLDIDVPLRGVRDERLGLRRLGGGEGASLDSGYSHLRLSMRSTVRYSG